MQCIQCDICGKYVNVWRETNFTIWIDNDNKEIKEICLDCVNEIEKKIKEMATSL